MGTPVEIPSLSFSQLFSFQVSYISRLDCRNSVIPEGSKKGEWRHGILEVDFSTETFFMQDRNRILLSQPFLMFDKHADFSSSEGCSLALKFNSDQWDIVLQNVAEKECVQHLLECIIMSMSIDEVVKIGKGKGITGLDNSIIKQGKVQQKSANQNRLDERYLVLVPGKLLVFKSHHTKGTHVRYVTSVLGATVRMLPDEQEFQVLAPGSKTLSFIPESSEELHFWVAALTTSIGYAKRQAASLRRSEEKRLQIKANNNNEYLDPNGNKLSRMQISLNQIAMSGKDSKIDSSQPSFSETKNVTNNRSTKEVQNDANMHTRGRLGMQQENKDVMKPSLSKRNSRQSKAMIYLENALDEMENTVSSVRKLAVSHRVNLDNNKITTNSGGTLKERDMHWDRWKKGTSTGEIKVPGMFLTYQTCKICIRSCQYEPFLCLPNSIDGISFTGHDRDLPLSAVYSRSSHHGQIQKRQNIPEARKSYSGTGLSSILPVPDGSPRRSLGLQRDPLNASFLRKCDDEFLGEDNFYGQHSDRQNTCGPSMFDNMQQHVSTSSSSEDEDEESQENRDHSSSILDAMRICEVQNPGVDTYLGNTYTENQSSVQNRQASIEYTVRNGNKHDQNDSSAMGNIVINQQVETYARYQGQTQPVTYLSQPSQQCNTSKESCGVAEAYDDYSERHTNRDSECQTMAPSISMNVDLQTIANNQSSNYSFHPPHPALDPYPSTERRPFDHHKGATRLDETQTLGFIEKQSAQAVINEPNILRDTIRDPGFSAVHIINKKLNRTMQHETVPYGGGSLHPDYGPEHGIRETGPCTHEHYRNDTQSDYGEEMVPHYVSANDNVNMMQNADSRVQFQKQQPNRRTFTCSSEPWQQGQIFNGPEFKSPSIANSRGYPQRYEAIKENNPANRHHAVGLPSDNFNDDVNDRGVNADLWWPSSRSNNHMRTEQAVVTRAPRSEAVQGWPLNDSAF